MSKFLFVRKLACFSAYCHALRASPLPHPILSSPYLHLLSYTPCLLLTSVPLYDTARLESYLHNLFKIYRGLYCFNVGLWQEMRFLVNGFVVRNVVGLFTFGGKPNSISFSVFL